MVHCWCKALSGRALNPQSYTAGLTTPPDNKMSYVALPTSRGRTDASNASSPSLPSHPAHLDDAGNLTDDPRARRRGVVVCLTAPSSLSPSRTSKTAIPDTRAPSSSGSVTPTPPSVGFTPSRMTLLTRSPMEL